MKQIFHNFLFFLAGLQSIPKSLIEAAAMDGAGPWRRFWSIQFPLLTPTTFFLLVINMVYAFFDTFAIIDATTQGGRARHRHPGLQGVLRRLQGAGSGRLGRAVGGVDGDRHRAHGGAVPLCREKGAVLMVERNPWLSVLSHAVMWLGVAIVAFSAVPGLCRLQPHPAGHRAGSHAAAARRPSVETYKTALLGGGDGAGSTAPVARMMWVSFVTAMVITVGKIAISLLSAFAVVYFRFPFKQLCFWAIFVTLMLPVEVRIGPTYQVVSDLGMLNSYAGLTVPLIASATATRFCSGSSS